MSSFEIMGEQKEVELPQGVIRYRESGTGQPIVFIHGLLVNGDLWRKVVPLLAKNYRCIVPDWPLGAHEIPMKPEADLTPSGIATIIADFVQALELKDVTIVGNDTGGAISQLVIAEYPQYVERLVLFNCDAFEHFLPPLVAPFQLFGYAIPLLIGYLKLDQRLKQPLILRILAKKPIERAAIESYFQPVLSIKGIQHDVKKVLRGISNRYTKQAATTFPGFKKPVLVIWAKGDIFFSVKDGKRLVKTFPNARLELVKDSRTFISEDQPERLSELIEAFLAQFTLAQR